MSQNAGDTRFGGNAQFYGDMGNVRLNGPVLDSVATPSSWGYYMVASDGGIFSFGDAKFSGSMGGKPLNKHGHVTKRMRSPAARMPWGAPAPCWLQEPCCRWRRGRRQRNLASERAVPNRRSTLRGPYEAK